VALLTKRPVFLQNAFGNPAYVNQTNLNGKLRKKLGWEANGGGHGPPRPLLESPLAMVTCKRSAAAVKQLINYEHFALSKTKQQTQVVSGLH